MAGLAASAHPAAARGLNSLTQAVNTQSQLRLIGRQEQADKELGMRISDILGQEVPGPEIPTGEMGYEGTPARPGSPEEAAGQGVLLPQTRKQRLSDVLGPGPTSLIKAVAGTPGYGREAFGLLASQAFPKPQFHPVTEWDPATKQMVTKWVDVSRVPSGTVIGRGKPQETLEDFQRVIGGQAPAGSPTAPREPIPEPPAGEPPPPPPYGSAPSAPVGVTGAAPTLPPRVSYNWSPTTGTTVHAAPGTYDFGQTTVRGADGRNYVIVQPRDPATGALGPPQIMGEAQANEKQTEIEGILDSFNIERSDPRYRQLYGLVASRPTDPTDQAVYMQRLYQMYGRRGEQPVQPLPQSGAPQSAPAQPRTPAPSAPSYSPTQRGVMPAPAAPSAGQGVDYLDVQREAARIKAQQAAAQAGQVKTATETAERNFPPKPEETVRWIHKTKWTAPPGNMSDAAIRQSGEYVAVDPQRARAVAQAIGVHNGLTQLVDILNRRRDIYPVATGSTMKDTYNLANAKRIWYTPGIQDYDPDIRRLMTLTADLPNFIRALGDTSGNVAVAERAMTEAGVGLHPSMRDAALASIETLRQLVNSGLLAGSGLSEMPPLAEPGTRPEKNQPRKPVLKKKIGGRTFEVEEQ